MFIDTSRISNPQPIFGRQNISLLKELRYSLIRSSINISPLRGAPNLPKREARALPHGRATAPLPISKDALFLIPIPPIAVTILEPFAVVAAIQFAVTEF